MFIGSFYHKLEAKGRVSLPKVFRAQTADWIITPGLDGGLFIFKAQDFATELQKLAQLEFNQKKARDYIRYLTNQAQAVTLDKTGRLLIPENLIQLASLTKNLVLVGSLSRIELWDQDTYHALLDHINQTAESIAEDIALGQGKNSQDNQPLSADAASLTISGPTSN